MMPKTIVSITYVIGAVGLAAGVWVRGNPRTKDFELGMAAGLLVAWMLDLLAPLMLELP